MISNKLETRVVVLSFDLDALAEVKRLNSSISTGALFKPCLAGPVALKQNQKLISAAIRCGADEIALHRLLAMRATVRLATERDLRVTVWTVNDPKWLPRARNLGHPRPHHQPPRRADNGAGLAAVRQCS